MSPDEQPTILTAPPNGSRPAAMGWQAPSVEEMQAMLPQYEVIDILGRGGMGAVYKARQKSLKRLVAIKILPLGMADDEMKFVERFQNEAQTMAAMNHPAIVSVYDFGETANGLLYFIMEYVDGSDVHKMIQASGKLSGEYALAITAHVCDALDYAHKRGVIHRDIKPANILIDQEGHIKVADFGLAKMDDPSQTSGLTKTNMAMGTPDYVAPEVLSPGTVADHRADLYAVGVMLYQMLTGEVPRGMFKLPSQKGIGSDPRFDQIICKAMEQDREERYQSAMDVRRALDVILTTPQPKDDGTGIVSASQIPQKPVAKQPRPAQKPAQKAAAALEAKAPAKKQSPAAMWLSIGGIVAVLGIAGFLVLGGKSKPVADLTDPSTASQPAQPQAPIKVRENPPSKPVSSPSSAKGKTIDLLSLVDLTRDEFEGDWTRTADGLAKQGAATLAGGNNQPRVRLPYEPPQEYDIEFEFTAGKGTQSLGLFLSAESRYFSWILGGGKGDAAGFELFDTKPTSVPNELSTKLEESIEAGRRYRSRVEVRAGTLCGYLDDKKLIDWDGRGKFTRLGTSVAPFKKEAHLGLRAARDVVFHNLTVREVSGAGKLDAVATTGAPSTSKGKTIDILALVDVNRDMIVGEWSRDGGDLLVKASKPGANGTPRLQLPYQPPEEYEFEIEFTPESGTNMVGQVLSAYQHSFEWLLDAQLTAGRKAGFNEIEGVSLASRTDGTTMRAKFLTNGQRHRSTVEVRRNRVRALLDGEPLVTWGASPKSYERLDISKNEKLRDALHLGLAAYDRAVRFHKLTVREITGTGKVDAGVSQSSVLTSPASPSSWTDRLGTMTWAAPWSMKDGALAATTSLALQNLGGVTDGAIRIRARVAEGATAAMLKSPVLQPSVRITTVRPGWKGYYVFQAYMPGRATTLIYMEREDKKVAAEMPPVYLWKEKPLPPELVGKTEIEWEFRTIGDELSLWAEGKLVASVHDSRLTAGGSKLQAYPGFEITRLETSGFTPDKTAEARPAAPPSMTNWQDVTASVREKARAIHGLVVESDGVRLPGDGSNGATAFMKMEATTGDRAVRVRYLGQMQINLVSKSGTASAFVLAQREKTLFKRMTDKVASESLLPLVPHPAGFDTNQPHELLLTVQGPVVRVWLDGRFVGDVQDDIFTNSTTALVFIPSSTVQKVETAALSASPSTTAPTTSASAQDFQGHRYQLVSGNLNWQEAKAEAEKLGGHLAVISSDEENDWAWKTFSTQLPPQPKETRWKRGWWLGASQTVAEKPWSWLTGESLSYECWGIKEPSTAISPPRYLWMADANKEEGTSNWSAQNGWIRGGFLVEWDTTGG